LLIRWQLQRRKPIGAANCGEAAYSGCAKRPPSSSGLANYLADPKAPRSAARTFELREDRLPGFALRTAEGGYN
jgi:hypothetical protein